MLDSCARVSDKRWTPPAIGGDPSMPQGRCPDGARGGHAGRRLGDASNDAPTYAPSAKLRPAPGRNEATSGRATIRLFPDPRRRTDDEENPSVMCLRGSHGVPLAWTGPHIEVMRIARPSCLGTLPAGGALTASLSSLLRVVGDRLCRPGARTRCRYASTAAFEISNSRGAVRPSRRSVDAWTHASRTPRTWSGSGSAPPRSSRA